MRDYHDTLSLIERQNAAFNSGNKYAERNQYITNKDEEYYKTFEREATHSFNNKYHGEKHSEPIWIDDN